MTLYRTPRLHSFSVRLYGIAPTILAASGRDCWIALFVYSRSRFSSSRGPLKFYGYGQIEIHILQEQIQIHL